MPELTKEQKEDLKNYEKKRKKYFIIIVVANFVIAPAFYYILGNKLPMFFYSLPPLIASFAFLIDIHYYKKCPACGFRIMDKGILGDEKLIFFSLPEKCNKCGIKLK